MTNDERAALTACVEALRGLTAVAVNEATWAWSPIRRAASEQAAAAITRAGAVLAAQPEAAHAATVQQAEQQAQEARTQRGVVLAILGRLGLPLRDWEAEGAVCGLVQSLTAERDAARRERDEARAADVAEQSWPAYCRTHRLTTDADEED